MVIDVTELSFEQEVLEGSRDRLVVVDFWAAWCAPCRALGPVLEAVAAAHEGEMVLAKVDVDASPRLQHAFGVRGIPAVKAFRGGRVVAEFTGALPRAEVERWVAALLPSEADRLATDGDEASLRAAIDKDPGHAGARTALARLLIARGGLDEAAVLLDPVRDDRVAAGLLARLELARSADGDGATVLPGDDGATDLDQLLVLVRQGQGERRELARRALVGRFAELGDDDPLVAEFRPRLASALY